ncbi:MAG: 5'/3'-nucleotidase SurE [Candidatus Thermoplasmatota archaeon]
MKRLLVTNDDGYTSAGFFPLLEKLSRKFSLTVVAPSSEKSWIGKAITTKTELQIHEVDYDGFHIFTVDGTPADCVQLGMYTIMETKPDCVVSGINQGENAGHARILSSGTVGAAMEAAFEGIPALAASIMIPYECKAGIDLFDKKNRYVFDNAAMITAKIVSKICEHKMKHIDLFSVNIPFDATCSTDLVITKPFKDPYGKLFHRTNKGYLHRTPPLDFSMIHPGSDLETLQKKKISLTPLSLDLVTSQSLTEAQQLFDSW